MCYPLGTEYTSYYRAYRQLALSLAENGFHVLRFDFRGCGDSEGEEQEGGVTQWLADIDIATAEIKIRCKSSNLCLVGFRFGATLAMMHGSRSDGISGIVLCDPIAQGQAYVRDLERAYASLSQQRHSWSKASGAAERNLRIPGLPPAHPFFQEVSGIDLSTVTRAPARNVLLIESVPRAPDQSLRNHLGRLTSQFDYRHLSDGEPPPLGTIQVVFANNIVDTAAAWIAATYS